MFRLLICLLLLSSGLVSSAYSKGGRLDDPAGLISDKAASMIKAALARNSIQYEIVLQTDEGFTGDLLNELKRRRGEFKARSNAPLIFVTYFKKLERYIYHMDSHKGFNNLFFDQLLRDYFWKHVRLESFDKGYISIATLVPAIVSFDKESAFSSGVLGHRWRDDYECGDNIYMLTIDFGREKDLAGYPVRMTSRQVYPEGRTGASSTEGYMKMDEYSGRIKITGGQWVGSVHNQIRVNVDGDFQLLPYTGVQSFFGNIRMKGCTADLSLNPEKIWTIVFTGKAIPAEVKRIWKAIATKSKPSVPSSREILSQTYKECVFSVGDKVHNFCQCISKLASKELDGLGPNLLLLFNSQVLFPIKLWQATQRQLAMERKYFGRKGFSRNQVFRVRQHVMNFHHRCAHHLQ